MTLLLTVFTAIISTICWYTNPKRTELRLSFLVLMYWGASLMWMCDAVFEYMELGSEYFTPVPKDMINDAFLGASVIAVGLVIWLVYLFVKDPEGIIKKSLTHR